MSQPHVLLTRQSCPNRTNHCPAGQLALRWLAVLVLGLVASLCACGVLPATSRHTAVAAATTTAVEATTTATAAVAVDATAPAWCTSGPPGVMSWIPLRSQSASDILAAVRQSAVFQMVTCAPPESDGYFDLSRLGAPVFIRGYGVNKEGGRVNAPDYYEIPAYSASGLVINLVGAQLNSAHTAITVGGVSSVTHPAPTFPGDLPSANQAVQIVQTQRHTGLQPGSQPHLIYLAAFNTPALETGNLTWNAGGGGPGDPIWLVPGADGHDYFVGTDAQSYTLAELPLK
jgi:hypothetical protein